MSSEKAAPPRRPGAEGVWLQTASGAAFDLLGEDPAQVSIRDIGASLAKLCRFNGHCTAFYSVAQHSVLVAEALRPSGALAQLYGLLHDAHQAYLGRMALPVKKLFAEFDVYGARADLEDNLQRRVHTALGLPHPVPEAIAEKIAEAGDVVLATELRDVMAKPQRTLVVCAAPFKRPILPWSWQGAEDAFVTVYWDLHAAARGMRSAA